MFGAIKSAMAGWAQLYNGEGRVTPPDPGNTANAPGDPPVQFGNYQYIQGTPNSFPNMSISDIPTTPYFGIDWTQFAVNNFGISGLEGGGATGDVPQVANGPTLYFDTTTGQYIMVNSVYGHSMSVLDFVKKHPVEIAGGVFAVGAIALVVISMGNSSAATTSTSDQTSTAADAAAEAAAQLQASASASQLAAQTQVDLASISAQTQNTSTQAGLALGLDQDSTSIVVNKANQDAAVAISTGNNNAAVGETSLNDAAQLGITQVIAGAQVATAIGADQATVSVAQANAQTQQAIAGYQAQSLETQANDQASVAKAQSGAAGLGSILGFLGNIL